MGGNLFLSMLECKKESHEDCMEHYEEKEWNRKIRSETECFWDGF